MTAPTIARPASAELNRYTCGCPCGGRDIGTHWHLWSVVPARRLFISTWRCGDEVATSIGPLGVYMPCPNCGRERLCMVDMYTWRQSYPPDRVTIGGLAEAHEHIVDRVVAGDLP